MQEKALILLIETATEICSIGLSDGDTLLALKESEKPYSHVSQITLLIDACLKKAGTTIAELDAVAVSSGPGSYTALRVGTAAAKGICYALEKPLLVVDTLKSLAMASAETGADKYLYCPMIDARRMEVYTAFFDGIYHPVEPTQALILQEDSFDQYLDAGYKLVISGNGAEKCQNLLKSSEIVYKNVGCSARHLSALAYRNFQAKSFENIAYYTPLYLKPPNITTPKKHL